MVEVQIALVIFGVALSGLAPYMVMYTKQLRKVQQRYNPDSTYYLQASPDMWSRKLGIGATTTDVEPPFLGGSLPATPTVNEVQILTLDKSMANQTIGAQVTVQLSP
jgi:hypothetical protein